MSVYAKSPEVDRLMEEFISFAKEQEQAAAKFNQSVSSGGRDPSITNTLMQAMLSASERSLAAFQELQRHRLD